jgi:hypothetical protein
MAGFPVCAVLSGCCLISRHSTSKHAAAGVIPEINIKSFFVFWAGRAGTLYFCGKLEVLPVILFKMCEVKINAATR